MTNDKYLVEPAEPAGGNGGGAEGKAIPVLAPVLSLTVTVEQGPDDTDEVHAHPGGQGFWIARMLRHLGETPVLCAPVGGEIGAVLTGLITQWAIRLDPVEVGGSSPTTVQDRRSGDRRLIAETDPPVLSRHELDDLYGGFLDLALGSEVCVVSGHVQKVMPLETYRRLGHDLASAGVKVVADIHGDQLANFLEGGPIDVLKVSDEDLIGDGLIIGSDEQAALAALHRLAGGGARSVVVSRAQNPTLAALGGVVYKVRVPDLEPADSKGAGDSMTAGLATALARGLGPEDTLKLATGAGAANVTRHGLGSGVDDLIAKLAERVEVEHLTPLG